MRANELLRIGDGCGSTVIFDLNYFVLLLPTFLTFINLFVYCIYNNTHYTKYTS